MKHKIYLSREKRGLGLTSAKSWIEKAANAALEAEKVGAPCELSVLLTDDEGIQRLNREFRNVDSATDVLSFPANEFEPGDFDPDMAELDPETDMVVLGDMALSIEHAVAQGEEFGHGTQREVQYLTVHSVLHLLGYDHVDEGAMKKQMRAREKEIMALIEGVAEE